MGCHCEENIFVPKEAKIVKAAQVTEREKHFTLKMADGAKFEYAPGQILEVSLMGYGEIPIGLASSPTSSNGTFDIVVRTVGRVSTAINRLEEGGTMLIRGPLGNGFPIDELKGHNVVVVAGGIGLCPTRSLIKYIMDERASFKEFTLLYGARNPEEQMFQDDLKLWRGSSDVCFHEIVDKGNDKWKGKVGVITNLFKEATVKPDSKVVICGPPIMFRFVIRELKKAGVKENNIFLDLERRMKCGVGKCGHCQINDKYVCIDGPVFNYTDLKQLEEAL
ncbi:MAG: FAD/NAD(P)-binding protein [Bacteriovoracaceae bacterium]|nr:FAD/NAD(P)-binding protein [Bacteriovoracaceae bacterium]